MIQLLPGPIPFLSVPLLIVDDDRTEAAEEYVQYTVSFTMSRISTGEPRLFIIGDDDGKHRVYGHVFGI